jgi:PII-like signaling protein
MTPVAAELLHIHIDEQDRLEGKPLHEVIVDTCRRLRIVGATVFLGLEGYGETAEIHRSRLLHRDRPVIVAVIDSADNIERLVNELEPMLSTGVLTVTDVEALRVENRRVVFPPQC